MDRRKLSRRALRAAALFGLTSSPSRPTHAATAAADLDSALRAGQIALIVGPSGGGKSSIASTLASRIINRLGDCLLVSGGGGGGGGGGDIIRKRAGRRTCAVVDLFSSPLKHTLSLLSRAGLAEASLFTCAVDDLSEGQRARLAIALAMEEVERCETHRADRPLPTHIPALTPAPFPTLILDEFASTLDRATAIALARTLRRWAACRPIRIVCATAHDDLLEPLAPDLLIEQPLSAAPIFHRHKEAA